MGDGVKQINEFVMKDGRTLLLTQFVNDPKYLPAGTIYINPHTSEMQYVNLDLLNNKSWKDLDINKIFPEGSLDQSLIKDNSIHGNKIIDLSISVGKIADLAITGDKIANKTITDSKFDKNTIDADKLKDSSIITSKIHDSAVTTDKITNGAVTTDKIANANITYDKLAYNSVNTTHIFDQAVTTKKIALKAINNTLIADRAISSNQIGFKAVTVDNLDNNSVTSEKIVDGAVFGAKIPKFAIKDNHIDAVDGYKINDNSISSDKLMNNAITSNVIADKAVTFSKLDSGTQDLINNSIKISPTVVIDNVEHYSTAMINGNMYIKNNDGSKATFEIKGDIKASGDITGARVFNPYMADIAEAYIPMCPLFPGDPVALCEEGGLKVTKLTERNYQRFIGFVSSDYATLLGGCKAEVWEGLKIPICLIGRIKVKLPVFLLGDIGDYINVTSYNGIFVTSKTKSNTSVGRLLEKKTSKQEYVLCQLWP
jgi:hypothetical protein